MHIFFCLQVFIGFVLKQFEYIEVGQFRYETGKDYWTMMVCSCLVLKDRLVMCHKLWLDLLVISALWERESSLLGNVLIYFQAPVVTLSDILGSIWLKKSGSNMENINDVQLGCFVSPFWYCKPIPLGPPCQGCASRNQHLRARCNCFRESSFFLLWIQWIHVYSAHLLHIVTTSWIISKAVKFLMSVISGFSHTWVLMKREVALLQKQSRQYVRILVTVRVKAWKKSLGKKTIVQNRAKKLKKYCMKPEQHILQKKVAVKRWVLLSKAVQFKLNTLFFVLFSGSLKQLFPISSFSWCCCLMSDIIPSK